MADRTAWRICRDNRWWSVLGKKRGRIKKAGPPVHDDLVRRDFTAACANRLWLADITEHATGEGELCLCAIKDVFSNRIVGYSIDERMKSRLAVAALDNAVVRRGHVAGCILHSDATPTVAYAQELIDTYRLPVELRPTEAFVRRDAGPYLDPWYKHLAEAYKATMADLGVSSDLTPQQFLDAMAGHKAGDPGMAAVLSAIKSTVKGGIGKLRERPQGTNYRPGERWPALERPTWRPDIRAAVISAARVNMHRKLLKTALATQAGPAPTGSLDALLPIALLSDCAVYPAAGPSPLDVLPYDAAGKPAPGTFRLGVSPGMVKHEGTQPLFWAVELLEQQHNPARHIKGDDALDDGE
ncbi:DDE-type integrase/transposase/recombinase [Actinacidiphila rubida]|nr:DDE-type integrase/transposase/recombinase [Actinacidiphila rubida]